MDRIGIPEAEKESISLTHQEAGSNCRAFLISPKEIESYWQEIEPHIARCVKHSEGELDSEDFKAYLLDEKMQLWIAIDGEKILASMVTQIVVYPKKRVLRIIAIGGGDMHRWISFLPALEELALEQGCASIEVWGRKGWLKILDDYKCSYHVLSKDLKIRKH